MSHEMKDRLRRLCAIALQGDPSWPNGPDTPLPRHVGEHVVRLSAISELCARFSDDTVVRSVLLKVVLDSSDDDRVRIAALQGMVWLGDRCLQSAALALVFDSDPELRLAALEGLWLTSDPMLSAAVSLLSSDDDEAVVAACQSISKDGKLVLSNLSP
jgi:HEAT repeat protein